MAGDSLTHLGSPAPGNGTPQHFTFIDLPPEKNCHNHVKFKHKCRQTDLSRENKFLRIKKSYLYTNNQKVNNR